jgi:alpha-amylase/alpha-mannosidase (GH57 family)
MTTRSRFRQFSRGYFALGVVALVLSACTDSGSTQETATSAPTFTSAQQTTTSSPAIEESASEQSAASTARLKVAFVFKYHQPNLPDTNGAIELPWTRLEAANNYLDLPQLLSEFDGASASVAMSSALIQQLESLTNPQGPIRIVDRYHQITNRPLSSLTADDRQFILNNFFNVPNIQLESFERWGELKDLRDAGAELSDADLRDLTVLFHLANLDAEQAGDDPELSALVARGSAYTDSDARLVLRAIDNQVDQIGRAYSEMLDTGRLEIITSPSAAASVGSLRLKANTNRAFAVAGDYFGEAPSGVTLPGDYGNLTALSALAAGGAQWVLVSEPALDPTALPPLRTSTPSGPVELILAHRSLAQPFTDTYAELSAADAVEDFVSRLNEIADDPTIPSPGLVTVVIDGVDTWQNYENNGRTFLRTLFDALSQSQDFALTTPSQYLKDHSKFILDAPDAAQYLASDPSAWQGESEESASAALLAEAYLALDEKEQNGLDPAALEPASRMIMNAEGADFTYFFGEDYTSADDGVYDRAFREWLGRAYDALKLERPTSLSVPIISQTMILPVQTASGQLAINIDGNPSDWSNATLFDFADSGDVITDVGIAIDGDALALRFDGGIEFGVQLYLGVPNAPTSRETTLAGDTLGFTATHLILWTDTEGACIADLLPPDSVLNTPPTGCVQLDSALSETGVEMKIDLDLLQGLAPGDVVLIRIKSGSSLGPIAGPIYTEVPGLEE